MTLSSQSSALMLIDDLDGAETVLDEAIELLEALNGSMGAALLQMRLADIRLRRGDFDGARELALRAVEDADLRATRTCSCAPRSPTSPGSPGISTSCAG